VNTATRPTTASCSPDPSDPNVQRVSQKGAPMAWASYRLARPRRGMPALRLRGHPWPAKPWRPAGRTCFTAAGASMPPAAFAALRPPAAPPGGRARARSGARRAFRRICPLLPVALDGSGWPVPRSRPCWQAQAGCRSAASMERPEGRMPVGSVRATGTGHPEPASPTTRPEPALRKAPRSAARTTRGGSRR
jgi:hypothetical protein